MNYRFSVALLGFALLAGCSTSTTLPDSDVSYIPETLEVTPSATRFDVTTDVGRAVYVEVPASVRLTERFRSALTQKGLTLADSREQAEVAYELDGGFKAHRSFKNRSAEVRLGNYIEKPALVSTRHNGINFMLGDPTLFVGTLLSTVAGLSSIGDSTNQWLVGDPDGVCLLGCGAFAYEQRAVVVLKRTTQNGETTYSAEAKAKDQKLSPNPLLQGRSMHWARQQVCKVILPEQWDNNGNKILHLLNRSEGA